MSDEEAFFSYHGDSNGIHKEVKERSARKVRRRMCYDVLALCHLMALVGKMIASFPAPAKQGLLSTPYTRTAGAVGLYKSAYGTDDSVCLSEF